MDLKQIRTFLALYEEGSVTKAAQRLNLVQPAISQQIRRIEVDHGVTLFTRTTHGLEPTPLAARLYKLCCRVAQDADQVKSFLSEARGRLSGTLAVGVPPSLAHGMLADVLLAFQSQAPDVRVNVLEGYSADLNEWLSSGQLDLAVMTTVARDDRLTVRPLLREELVLADGDDIAELGDEPVEAARLSELPLVLPTSRNTLRVFIDAELARAGIVVEPRLEVDSLAVVLALISAGGMASILPAITLVGSAAPKGIHARRIVNPTLSRDLVIARKASRELTDAGEAFAGLLASRVQKSQMPA